MELERKEIKLSNITKKNLTKSLILEFIKFSKKNYNEHSDNYALMLISGGKILETGYCEPKLEFLAVANQGGNSFAKPIYMDLITSLNCKECIELHTKSLCDYKFKKLYRLYAEKMKNITLPLLESTCVGDVIQLDLSTFTLNEIVTDGISNDYKYIENIKEQYISYLNESKKLLNFLKSENYTFEIHSYDSLAVILKPTRDTCVKTGSVYQQTMLKVSAKDLSKHFRVSKVNNQIRKNFKTSEEKLFGYYWFSHYGL